MQTSKNLRILSLLLLAVIALLSFSACGSGGTASSSGSVSSAKEPLYTVNGVDITFASVEMVGETPNLMLIFANNTDEDIEVDFSKLAVKLSDGTEIGNFGLMRTMEANRPRIQHAITIEQKYGIKTGDTVEIYYGDDKIAVSEVTEM